MATGLQLYKVATSASSDSNHSRLQVDANGVLQLVNSSGTALPVGEFYLFTEMDDVSTAASSFVPATAAGTITKLKTALHGAITGADAVLTAEIGGVAITGISTTITQSGSAAGDIDTDTATAANTLAENDSLELISDGASSTARRLTGVFTVERRA